MTEDLVSMTWDRDHQKLIAEKHAEPLAWAKYRKLRNKVNKVSSKLKEEYFRSRVEEVNGDSGRLWSTLKQLLGSSSKSKVESVMVDGVEVTDKLSVVNAFNDFSPLSE